MRALKERLLLLLIELLPELSSRREREKREKSYRVGPTPEQAVSIKQLLAVKAS